MTPQEIKTALNEICAPFGGKARASIIISGDALSGKDSIFALCHPNGYGHDECVSVNADTFEDAIAKLNEAVASNVATLHAETIRKMALSIITTTADLGKCSDAALRGNGFSQSQIDMHGSTACAEATRLAAGGPFEIVRLAALANAAE